MASLKFYISHDMRIGSLHSGLSAERENSIQDGYLAVVDLLQALPLALNNQNSRGYIGRGAGTSKNEMEFERHAVHKGLA